MYVLAKVPTLADPPQKLAQCSFHPAGFALERETSRADAIPELYKARPDSRKVVPPQAPQAEAAAGKARFEAG